jgi:chemotaxis protein CheX
MTTNLRIIPQLIEVAVHNAFKVQLATAVSSISKTMDPKIFDKYSVACMSTLMMTSNDVTGSLSIGFPKDTFLKLVERMLGEVSDTINPETADAGSEVLNIIYSSSRKEINEHGFQFNMSIPSTVTGSNLSLSKSNLAGTVLFNEFTSDLGNFLVILSLELQQNKKVS